jgi:hypothetical protein
MMRPFRMNADFGGRMRVLTLLALAAFAAQISCSAADVARQFKNADLEGSGIQVRFKDVPRGMYDRPFIIRFDRMLYNISNGGIQVMAYNIYTVGNFDKIAPGADPAVSNFLDPASKFKDAWFGMYIILDDDYGMGRRFILMNPHGEPDDLSNLNDHSLLMLPELDQKIIVWSTHQGQQDYSLEDLDREFYFNKKKGTTLTKETVTDGRGWRWRAITGDFETIAALTDVRKTGMQLFSSIRNYIGLPVSAVYERVEPWHPVLIRGRLLARYFRCEGAFFWAVAYYNGSAFTDRAGRKTDSWKDTDLRTIQDAMFRNIEIDCAKQ